MHVLLIVLYLVGGTLTIWLWRQYRGCEKPVSNTLRASLVFWFWPVPFSWLLPAYVAELLGFTIHATEWE